MKLSKEVAAEVIQTLRDIEAIFAGYAMHHETQAKHYEGVDEGQAYLYGHKAKRNAAYAERVRNLLTKVLE